MNALGCWHVPSACYECTIRWILVPRNTLWRVISADGRCPPRCFASRSLSLSHMPALLPVADESAMNVEGLGAVISTYFLFFVAFLRVGSKVRRERGCPVSGGLRSHIGPVLWLGLRGAIIRPAY